MRRAAIAALLLSVPAVSSPHTGLQLSTALLAAAAQNRALADSELLAFLARVQGNNATNAKLSQQYTADEFWHNRNFDKGGKTTVDESAKYENVFVEGLPYRKKIEANGKPLTGKEATAEQRRYDKAVRERRSMTTEQKRMSLHRTWHFALPMCCLATLFTNHVVGYEQVDGRELVVVESFPRPDAKPANKQESSALNWKQKSWIDLADAMFVRIEAESLSDRDHVAKGTTTRLDFQRVIDTQSTDGQESRAVWLLRAHASQFRFKLLWVGATGTTQQIWSNFKKFHVDMRLLEDTVVPMDGESGQQ